jgi:hypothetical protein
MRFFTGLHQPSDTRHFEAAFISVNRLRPRKAALEVRDWIMDSGAYTEISRHGRWRSSVAEYAAEIQRWQGNGRLLAAVAQDWPCDPDSLEASGLDVAEHQRLTIERYDELLAADPGAYVMPVLQGWAPADYLEHLRAYGERLAARAWVCVGSLVGRSRDPRAVAAVLHPLKQLRPDLQLHGLGLKKESLAHPLVRGLLASADSMSWSLHARRNGRSGNDWREARDWAGAIDRAPVQHLLDLLPASGGEAAVDGALVADAAAVVAEGARRLVDVVDVAVEGAAGEVEALEVVAGQHRVDVAVPVDALAHRLRRQLLEADRAGLAHLLLVRRDDVVQLEQSVLGRQDQDARRPVAVGGVLGRALLGGLQRVLEHCARVQVACLAGLGRLLGAARDDVGDQLAHFVPQSLVRL